MLCSTLVGIDNVERDIDNVGPVTESIDKDRFSIIYYISESNGSDMYGEGSKHKPWATIQFALENVGDVSENKVAGVFVSSGRYTGHTLEMKPYVELYGGFNSESWERDIYQYSTYLDGENKRRVIIGSNNSRIDGFIITNGRVRSHGGGILCDDTSPIISNCFILNNFVLEPEQFNHNRIHQYGNDGGAIAVLHNATPIIRNNVFYGNKTSIGHGGAIALKGWLRMADVPKSRIEDNVLVGGIQPVIRNNVFIENISGVNDVHNTRSSNGGAISITYEQRPIIENNLIAHNHAKGNSDGGGIYNEYYSYPIINSNWIIGNIADDDAGGIYTMRLGHPIITNNIIAGNKTVNEGNYGGIRISKEGRARILNNVIVRNQTGGGVQCIDSYMELKDNVIMHNRGTSGIHYRNAFTYFKPSVIEENIIQQNEGLELNIENDSSELVNVKNNSIHSLYEVGATDNRIVQFENDSILGKISNIKYDALTYQTIISVTEQMDNKMIKGRVIKIGDFWGIIKEGRENKIFVWGNVGSTTTQTSNYEIISSYKSVVRRR